MERTAYARLSKSKFRAVTTTVIQLDSGDVICAKDRETMARQMSKRRESCNSMGTQGEASASHVGTEAVEVSSRPSEPMQEAGGVPIYKESPAVEDSSGLAKIARRASHANANEAATEHVIPGIRQAQSEGISESTTNIKEAENQDTERSAHLPALDVDRIDNPPAAIDTHVNPPQSNPKRNSRSKGGRSGIAHSKITCRNPRKSQSSAQTSLEQIRPRRSARRASTSNPKADVDWSEDIRPTDDDKSSKNGREASKHTSVSSPDAESNKVSNKKRKAPKVKPGSGKRQKAAKGKDHISARLPLTTETGDNPDSASNIFDEQLDNAGTWDAVDLPVASFPIFEQENANEPKAMDQHGLIELSSDSLLPSNMSSPAKCTDSPKANGQGAKATCHGRGITVGQKIADALREAGLNPQNQPTVESRFSSTLMPAGRTAPKVPKDYATLQTRLQTRVHRPQNPFSPGLEMVQDEPSAPSTAGGQASSNDQDLVPIANTDKPLKTTVSVESPVPPAQCSSDIQKLLHSAELLKRRGSGDKADDPMEIPDDSSQATHSPEAMWMDSIQPDTYQDNLQVDTQHLESELDTLSQSAEVPILDCITMLPVQESESEQTPESQKPLLSAHTRTRQGAPLEGSKSIKRKSVVDRNGSPRLCPQEAGEPRLDIDRFLLQSIRIADSSSSEYDEENSDGYYSESKYQPGSTWSKFQRDMFMEYGIGPEELTPGITGTRLVGDGVNVDSRASQLSAATSEEDTELRQDEHRDHSIARRHVSHDEIAPPTAPRFIPTTIDDPKMEAEDDANVETNQRRGSTESSGSTSHHLLMHGNLENMDWISDLQSAQQSAHSLLLETNQLAAEQHTIRKVLQIYRQGCNRILDDLSRAQEARMQLYRQQMSSVKEQHTQICQELIQGLQELDHRV
ncbi:uncharacterized protein N7496_001972 [Penicillium cataractarum]|uniref:Uncharacterized protein n=1 Tax=Penicillium cataractarum TaxID=2100454 RepID=A0A9X0B7C8_9EURO|nr:uncharacterized protein N7496_001972 [Penicillium cataractarum]KAJ5390904.1 hypothetical protein N7496_001972 [Penicillium cataractarum]